MKSGTVVLVKKLLVILAAAMMLWTADNGFASALTPSVGKVIYRSGNSEVSLPLLTGLRDEKLQATLNAAIKSTILSFATERDDVSLHGDYEVLFNNGKLLVFRFHGYSMQPGLAHPNKIDRGVHMDLATGKIYELSDLFYPGVDFAAKIVELCEKQQGENRLQIEDLFADWRHTDFANSWVGVDRAFVLGLSSLRAYSIPNYAIGSISGYRVDYADLLPIIDQSGPLWQSLRSNVIDPERIKAGDRVAGLAVASLEKTGKSIMDVSFAGEVELTGIVEWSENTGDGAGYLFTVTAPESSKLPAFGRERETRVIAVDIRAAGSFQLPPEKTKVRIVIDALSLGERQIAARAKVIKLTRL
jgi:hypothetical protein